MSLADKILNAYKQKIRSLSLLPSSGGCFELSIGDEVIYSKLATGEFPEEEQMVAAVAERLG